MSQGELHRALARATGESVRSLRRFGFSLLVPDQALPDTEEPDEGPQIVDWDRLEAERLALAIVA